MNIVISSLLNDGFIINMRQDCLRLRRHNFYELIITSDHGNIDTMYDENNIPITTHTMSPVPFILCDENVKLKEKGDITMIAPTLLKYMDIKIPEEMSETPLLFVRED